MRDYEEVNGIIIGGEYQLVKLIAPNGGIQCKQYIPINQCPIEWAKNEIACLKSERCGNGKPISEYPDIFKQIYGDGDFTVSTDY